MSYKPFAFAFAAVLFASLPAAAQQAEPPYGPVITLQAAKKVMAAAEAEAARNNWPAVITIIDSGGNMVMMQRMDDAQLSAIAAAEGKAQTALAFKRPSKQLEEAVSAGGAGLRLVGLKNLVAIEGGLPIVSDGKIVGAIGVSGLLSAQNTQVARAGIDALGN
jgi:glc operon protein GlcG